MSHSTVTVALPGHLPPEPEIIREALTAALEPFNENTEVERYVAATREQIIAKGREEIAEFRDGRYAEYLKDPQAYREKFPHAAEAHFAYLDGTGENGGFPAKLKWTDEQIHADALRYEDEDDIGPDGEIYSTYNPQSKWDWYSIGGRWPEYWRVLPGGESVPVLTDKSWAFTSPYVSESDASYIREYNARPGPRADVVRKSDIDFTELGTEAPTFAFLTSAGVWNEKARMGWWGMTSDDKPEQDWVMEYRVLTAAEPEDAWFVLVDVHI